MTEPEGVIEAMIDAITEQAKDLTEWEQGFINSMRLQWKFKRWINDEQEQKLTEIYEERV